MGPVHNVLTFPQPQFSDSQPVLLSKQSPNGQSRAARSPAQIDVTVIGESPQADGATFAEMDAGTQLSALSAPAGELAIATTVHRQAPRSLVRNKRERYTRPPNNSTQYTLLK
jgi:hypothetical protein